MLRLALGVAYQGAKYHGWQIQDELLTVQAALQSAVSNVANHPVTITCAGRTDAGVHATSQVVHFDTYAARTPRSWVFGANSNLPSDISVQWAKVVNDSFHARYSALRRRYRYVIYNHVVRPAILGDSVSWFYRPLDEKRMALAAEAFLGEHDFSSFRGTGCQSKTAIRRIDKLEVTRRGRLLVIDIQANAFLLHMVRNIVGVLMAIGDGHQPVSWAKQVLVAKDRRAGGVTAMPQGLYLVEVAYPSEFQLPKAPLGPFFLD